MRSISFLRSLAFSRLFPISITASASLPASGGVEGDQGQTPYDGISAPRSPRLRVRQLRLRSRFGASRRAVFVLSAE